MTTRIAAAGASVARMRAWLSDRPIKRGIEAGLIASMPQVLLAKTEEWLLCEVLADRGETVVLGPQRLRDAVARRAKRLQRELGRVPTRR